MKCGLPRIPAQSPKSEVKFVATVPVAQLQKQIDGLAKSFRELDTKLQELNWKTDLV